MKSVIFTIMTFFMFSSLGASTETLNRSELRLGYSNIVSSDQVDMFSTGLFGIKPKGFTDLEFRVGIADGLKKLEEKYQKDSGFMNKVVVWMSFKF